jgi:hypothetical protein
MARRLGMEPMPWQRDAWDIGLEYEVGPNGEIVPAYREVIATVMRQCGKSVLAFSVMAHRSIVWHRQPQRSVYTAQDGSAARKKLVEDFAPMLTDSPSVKRFVERVYRGIGYEGVNFKSGSTVRIIGSSEQAGHGITNTGLAIIDESFSDVDNRREQALLPSMATVRDAQTWNVSTAGTDASVFLRRKIDAGRAACEAGLTSGIAYIEYSIPDDADVDDPEVWWAHMPALGWTISEDVVRGARRSMSDGDFRRSFGNQWTATDERAIPEAVWLSVQTQDAPSGMLRFAVEVDPERESACVVASGDNNVLELVESRHGVSWVEDELPARVIELAGRHGGVVRIDAGGPAGYLLPRLENAGVLVEKFATADVVKACSAFYDGLADRRVLVRRSELLDEAAAGVQRRRVGESWAWQRRRGGVAVMALSLAAWRDGSPSEFFAY